MQKPDCDVQQSSCQTVSKTAQEAEEMKIELDKNTIVCGDNLEWLSWIPDESIDLCYIDPPFFSNATYEKIWGNGWEVASFGDRFAGGIVNYIEWMRPRIKLIHQKLKQSGSIFLHCDYHASHRLRLLLDEEFQENFLNEIIWSYGAKATPQENYFPKKHDSIFWYKKGVGYTYNPIIVEYAEATLRERDSRYKYSDKDGQYRLTTRRRTNGEKYRAKVYLQKGVSEVDVWDLPIINATAKERIGYRTQKPEALIKRIIECASNKGDVVLDCFAGGFTTAKVCSDLNRKFICGDVSPVACKIGAKRLNKANFHDYEIKGMPQTEQELRELDGHEFAETICDLMGWKCNPKKSNDKGIDGWDGNGNPVQIKNHRAKTGEKDLRNFWGTLQAAKKTTGIFVAWDFCAEGVEFVAKYKKEVDIQLRKCRELVEDIWITNEKRQQIEDFYNEKLPEDWKENPLTPDVDLPIVG